MRIYEKYVNNKRLVIKTKEYDFRIVLHNPKCYLSFGLETSSFQKHYRKIQISFLSVIVFIEHFSDYKYKPFDRWSKGSKQQ